MRAIVDPVERFQRHFRKEAAGCWIWTGSRKKCGYGLFNDGNRTQHAHRFAYTAFRGPIPGKLVIDHICRVKGCVNPAHLRAITQAENVLAGVTGVLKGPRKSALHCRRGHSYANGNVIVKKNGYHECRTCKRAANARWDQAQRQKKEAQTW